MESQDQYLETMKGYELDVQRMKSEFIDLKIKNAQAIFKLKSQPSITSQVAALQKTMSDIDGHFQYLLNPVKLPEAYKNSLEEVSRRRKYYTQMKKAIEMLTAEATRENERRDNFLAQYGKILPQEFLPQLKQKTALIKVVPYSSDPKDAVGREENLPSIESESTFTLQLQPPNT